MPEKLFSGKWWRGNELGGVVTLTQWCFAMTETRDKFVPQCDRVSWVWFQLSKSLLGVKSSKNIFWRWTTHIIGVELGFGPCPLEWASRSNSLSATKRSSLSCVESTLHRRFPVIEAFGHSASCGRCICTTKQCRHGWEVDFRLSCRFHN